MILFSPTPDILERSGCCSTINSHWLLLTKILEEILHVSIFAIEILSLGSAWAVCTSRNGMTLTGSRRMSVWKLHSLPNILVYSISEGSSNWRKSEANNLIKVCVDLFSVVKWKNWRLFQVSLVDAATGYILFCRAIEDGTLRFSGGKGKGTRKWK